MSDEAARERAAHEYRRNAVVVAGAGTGKTTLLVERVLCQMVEDGLELDAFAAITFTEKAAAELRVRLAESLAELARLAEQKLPSADADEANAAGRAYRWLREREQDPERIGSLARARLAQLAGAQLSTIHAFCAGLLRRHPLECGVDPDFSVDTGLRFESLKDELWSEYLAGPHGPDGASAARWRRVLRDLDSAEVELLARALATFAPAAHAAARGLPEERVILEPIARDALARIDACTLHGAAKGPESWLRAMRPALVELRDHGMEAFRAALETATWTNAKGEQGMFEASDPTSKDNRPAEALVKELRKLAKALRAIENELLAEAVALVRPYTEIVRAEARRRGILPFDALLWLARELLRTHPDVRRELGGRYRTLLVDEFQDTDPVQYEIVFFLAEDPETGPARQAFETRLAPGKLFIVGDPKQAIYRFRGADLAAYHEAVAHVLERNQGARYTLTRNWRARPEVLAPLGPLLQPLLERPADDRANAYSGYDPLDSGRAPAGRICVELWRVGDPDPKLKLNAADSRLVEARAIAEFVAGEVASQRARAGDFALLFRSLRDVRVYARELRERGLACWIGRSDEPEREPAPQQLLALLRALANPADAPAVLGVLRSPLGAVPDVELSRWAAHFELPLRARAWSYPNVSPPDDLPNLARAFALLREWRRQARELAPADLLASLLEETPLLAIHAHARDGQRRVRDLESLLERLADSARATPGCDLGDVVRALEANDPRSVEDDDARTDRVRLLTIHGAKGLEFETVFLPDLSRPKGNPPRNVEVELVRAQGALAVRTRAGTSASWLDFETEAALHERAELGRLFYVACTRARERLFFVDSYRQRTPAGALIEFVGAFQPERAVPEPEAGRGAPEIVREIPADVARQRTREALAAAATCLRAPFRSPSGLREELEARDALRDDADVSPPEPLTLPQRQARAVGLLVHDALERWDFRDPGLLRRLAREAALRVARRDALDPRALETEAESIVEGLLASELPAHLAGVELIGRELPLVFRDADGTPWSGSIDLLYRDADGRLVIADYKTDRAPDAAASERYRPQLETYARGVALLFPEEQAPALELVYVRSGRRERLLESAA